MFSWLTFGLWSAGAGTKPAETRDSRWPKVRAAHLQKEPRCAACGSKARLEVHHLVPVHLARTSGRPELELDERNLITLCEGDVVNCHLLFGHLRCWKSWNKRAREDAREWLERVRRRPML